jgi:hypothetical protein
VLSAGLALEALQAVAGHTAGPDRGVSDFWTAGDMPSLPTHPELPVDLLLRLLPVPGAGLGGSRLLAQLGPLYDQLPPSAGGSASGSTPGSAARSTGGSAAEPLSERAAGAPGSSRSSGPARPTRRVGKTPETY